MKIKHLEILNFKGIKEASFDFSGQFNLIIGDNGSGKTSVLEAATVALGAFLSGIDGVASNHFTTDEIRRVRELIGQGSVNTVYEMPIKVTCDLEIGGEVYHFVRQKKSLSSSRTTVEPRNVCHTAAAMAASSDAILPVLSYQSFARIAAQKKDKWTNVFGKENDFSRVVGYTDCFADAANTKMLTNWCQRMDYISYQREEKIAEYEAVKAAVSNFITAINDITPAPNMPKLLYDKREEELMFDDGGSRLPVRLLSAGYRTLIGMVSDIAFRMAVLNPALGDAIVQETPGIVLIDEIDMHLHPKWQWRIVSALKSTFPNVQFIVTTHSPLVISSSQNENLIYMDATRDGISIKQEESFKGWQVNDVLTHVMDSTERDPDTIKMLKQLEFLAYKRLKKEATEADIAQYEKLRAELSALLPETDLSIDMAGYYSFAENLKD